ncbi:MAG TPA: ferrous iron transport protein A [Firmicutes bacterium]|nr:ferrous iron transport protein A [Bacillota bacterium]
MESNGGNGVLPLVFLPIGRGGVVKEIIGGPGLRKRLADLGFARGAVVRVIQSDRGPLIVALGDSRVALGYGMAQKVMVEELP